MYIVVAVNKIILTFYGTFSMQNCKHIIVTLVGHV